MHKAELMKEDSITLKFSLAAPCAFELGDYVDFAEHTNSYPFLQYQGRYELINIKNAKPTYNTTTGGYDYSLRLDAYYWKWANKILKFAPGTHGSESEWSITSTIENIGSIIAQNLRALNYKYRADSMGFILRNFEVQLYRMNGEVVGIDDPSEMITLTFNGNNIIEALNMIAQKANGGRGCEWWVDENIIYFGKCERGELITIDPTINAASIARANGENDMTNRIYAFGSKDNIPFHYRKNLHFKVDVVRAGNSFADLKRPLRRDMFNPNAIEGADAPYYTLAPSWQLSVTKAAQTITVDGTYQIQQAIAEGLYTLEPTTPLGVTLFLSEYPDRFAKGTAHILLKGTSTRWSGVLSEGTYEFNVESERPEGQPNAHTIEFNPQLESKYSDIPALSEGLLLSVQIVAEFETKADLTNQTAGTAQNSSTYRMTNTTQPFYAKVRFVHARVSDLNGMEKWVKIQPNTFVGYNNTPNKTTLYTACRRDSQDNFTPIVIDPQLGDIFEFVQDGDGQDFLYRSKVPAAYFTAQYNEELTGMTVARLQLPNEPLYDDGQGNVTREWASGRTRIYDGEGYVDAEPNLPTQKIVESVRFYEDIKPNYEGTINTIGVKTFPEKFENGEKTGAMVYNYVFFDTQLRNFRKANSLSDKNMEITFSSGKCNGLTFEVEVYSGLLDDGVTRANGTSNSGTWLRIVPNDAYAVRLPNQYIYPDPNDTYNISGYDVSLIDSVLLPLAEIKLFNQVRKDLEGLALDQGTYTVVMQSNYTKTLMVDDPDTEKVLMFDNNTAVLDDKGRKMVIEAGAYSPTYTQSRLRPYYVGRRVRLQDLGLFPQGGRDTRILSVENPLDFPWDAVKLTCGETAAYSRLKKIEQKIENKQ